MGMKRKPWTALPFVLLAAMIIGGACSPRVAKSGAAPGSTPQIDSVGEQQDDRGDNTGLLTAREYWRMNRPEPHSQRESFLLDLSDAALESTLHEVVYDPAYVKLDYPGGDVPADRGVCSDVVIRAYRVLNIDLQKDVHEDMAANFKLYPKKWGLKKTDTNIDHRRVANLMVFFTRKGKSLPVSDRAADYTPGDIVAWDLNGNGLLHIGIVTYDKSEDGKRNKIVHNIGAGHRNEDVLFSWKIIGHYRYFGNRKFDDE